MISPPRVSPSPVVISGVFPEKGSYTAKIQSLNCPRLRLYSQNKDLISPKSSPKTKPIDIFPPLSSSQRRVLSPPCPHPRPPPPRQLSSLQSNRSGRDILPWNDFAVTNTWARLVDVSSRATKTVTPPAARPYGYGSGVTVSVRWPSHGH